MLKFQHDEVNLILQACDGKLDCGKKPTCLTQLARTLTLSCKEFRELVRYLKTVAMSSIKLGVVGCGVTYQLYVKVASDAIRALEICNSVKMQAIRAE